jgi:RNA polymerase sigma-70 factor (ECF subfamily)
VREQGYDAPDMDNPSLPDDEEESDVSDSLEGPPLSDFPTMQLIVRARRGDEIAAEALLQRALPRLRRWAHGRLPTAARRHLDTGDLVQDAAMNALKRLEVFEPQHVGALQAYLRQSVINRIRDEVRKLRRRPGQNELTEDLVSEGPSPLELAIQGETYERYAAALERLRPRHRQLVVARIEAQWSIHEIADHFGFGTSAAAGTAVSRALKQLRTELGSK